MAYQTVQQPVPAAITNVVVNMQPQRGTNQLLLAPFQGQRTWSTGLFDCFTDIPSCLLTCFCTICVESHLSTRTGECCCTPCCVPGSALALRARIRTAGGITGNMCNDFATLIFCGPCAICQMSRELDNMDIP